MVDTLKKCLPIFNINAGMINFGVLNLGQFITNPNVYFTSPALPEIIHTHLYYLNIYKVADVHLEL